MATSHSSLPQAQPLPISRIAGFVIAIQLLLFVFHAFVFESLSYFFDGYDPISAKALAAGLFLLSVTFVPGTLLAHRYFNKPVRVFYRFAATWLGILNFIFLASVASWLQLGLT